DKFYTEDIAMREELQTRFGVTPQKDIDIVRQQDPEQFFGWANGLAMLTENGPGALTGGLAIADQASHAALESSSSLGLGINVFSILVMVAGIEKQLLEFSLSQLQTNSTVSPYTDGTKEADQLSRQLSVTFDATKKFREQYFTSMASLTM